MAKKNDINYLYFTFILLTLSALSIYHYTEQPLSAIPLFFLLYAIGQASLEVCVFILITYILKRWAPNWVHLLFISASFIFLLLHYTNFTMVRLMDTSMMYIFKFFFGSGIDHLIAGFQALNMNVTMIAMTIGTFLLIPAAGLGLYFLTGLLIKKKPLNVSLSQIIISASAMGAILLLFDILAHSRISPQEHSKYTKTLPLGSTFLSPSSNILDLSTAMAPFRNEEIAQQSIPKAAIAHLPNIYFFVIETLRKDFLTAAPNLTRFGNENIEFEYSFANASCTHLSWFSIFHSDIPLHWTSMRDHWQGGSIPLRMLKKMGYEIEVFSSADLRYFQMDKLIFGQKRELADKVEEYSFHRNLEPCDRDALAFKSLKENLKPMGKVYLIFLDSTHSEYSFPKDFPLQYTPISKEIDYLTIGPKSLELELIKNRYRNAICYIDQLMGSFFDMLKEKNLFDDAIIAITGDHGEEFFEEGALFHGTHLNHYQTSVPIFFKFPSKEWISQTQMATHIDLFPSILHYLTKQSDFSLLFDGKSIFSLDRSAYRIAVLQNGPNTPIEFTIEKPDLLLRAKFVDSKQLEIVELRGFLEPDTLSELLKKS